LLYKKDFPAYFKYLSEERALAANNAHTDPNTFEFLEVYLTPLNINSMLDAPIRLGGKMIGMICNEFVGGFKNWSQEEQNFSGSLADFISRAFEEAERKKAQDELEETNRELEQRVEKRTEELKEKMNEILALKEMQDGDYYLTSLIQYPLSVNRNKSEFIKTEFHIEQKKKFKFRKYNAEIGGDICITGNLRFGDGKHRNLMFVNGDAMGKSMQGAWGAIVMGTAINSIMNISNRNNRILQITKEEWLIQTYNELNNMFLAFSGSMLISAIIGILDEISGELIYINAEHPNIVLYRKERAIFLSNSDEMNRKLGTMENPDIKIFKENLFEGDVLIIGSDGIDDLELSSNNGVRVINEDESRFLGIVSEAKAD
jgi:serine phosphatase RsbU (regulator of sigma subunit)